MWGYQEVTIPKMEDPQESEKGANCSPVRGKSLAKINFGQPRTTCQGPGQGQGPCLE